MTADPYVPAKGQISKGGLFGALLVYSDDMDPNVKALLAGTHWTQTDTGYRFADSLPATVITYSFPKTTADYPAGGMTMGQETYFLQSTAAQQAAFLTSTKLIESYTKLTFTSAPTANSAAVTLAGLKPGAVEPDLKTVDSSAGYPPSGGDNNAGSGSIFLAAGNGIVVSKYFGTDPFLTVMHEFGHALGLKHGHGPNPPGYQLPDNGVLQQQFDDNEFSVMTYRSYLDSPDDALPTAAVNGSSPQSYMMFDIAALQVMYGANFGKVGTNSVYTWNADTGQQFLNDQAAPNTATEGTSAGNKIFSTIWTQGATSTYDLHNFGQDQVDDMRPGKWMTFSNIQLAQLDKYNENGPRAQGNIYNALQYKNNQSSLIDNLLTGSGNDKITGNDKGNHIDAGAGRDTIQGGNADDFITGGPDSDIINTGRGYDTLRDTPTNMNGDYVTDFGKFLAVDYVGIRVGLSKILIDDDGNQTTFKVAGSALLLNGNFDPSDGLFMADPRGSTSDAFHTTVKYVPFLADLNEGVRVSNDDINGVINRSFLTGDGSVHFTATLDEAVSSFHNELGYFLFGPDGTISTVHMLFGNTHNPGNTNVDLGTPGNGMQIGFFLVPDGFTKFGALADNLSFVVQDAAGIAANVNGGQTLLLMSATLGALGNANVLFSTSPLNPGGQVQVLSGTDAGGHDLHLGFEDTVKGDQDFQDVVLVVHNNAWMLYGT